MVILSFVVSCYELVTEPFILCICLGFTLCFVFAAPAEADRLLTLLVAFFRPPLADFPQLWSSIKRTFGVLLDQQLEAMSICSQLDSFHTALVELTKQAKSASLVRKEHIIRQLFDIMSVSQGLKVALQHYHFETDMSSYRIIQVHDQALINLQDAIGPLSHLYAPVTPQSERARRNKFVPCLVEHRRSVLRTLTKLECCWSLLHMFGGSITQLDSIMAETNPSLHNSYSSSVFSNMWSLLCVDLIDGNGDHVKGSQEALSQGALITMREGIASHLLAGRNVLEEARGVIQNLRDGGSVDDDEFRYEEEIKCIVNGIEELRKVRADFQAKRFAQPLPSL